MALFRLVCCFLCGSTAFAAFPTEVGGQMLYLLHRGEAQSAFENYLKYARESEEHDFALLQQAGIRLLEQGIESGDPETQLMCMFGAGVANSPDLLPILEKGIHSKEPRIQLIALSYLGKQNDDLADRMLLHALSSPFLLTRLEGCYQLAQKNHPAVLMHLQSLMVKVPDFVRALFPQIVVHLDSSSANQYLRQLLADSHIEVRIEAILSAAKLGRDDFLPQIRNLAAQAQYAQQEACALALGELKDAGALPLLKELAESGRKEVRLAAAIALFELGEYEALDSIKEQARLGDLFAITALGKLKEGKEILRDMISHAERDVRLNATLSLLQLGEAGPIEEILIPGGKDFGFTRLSSPGHGLSAWKTVPSHHQNTKKYPGIIQQTMSLRDKVLAQCIELPEPQFLKIARRVIAEKQTELIPLLVVLLENKRSDKSLVLLKEGQQKAGEPLIRNYCTLALYRLREEGPYEEQLINWVKSAASKLMIEFREEDEEPTLSIRHELAPEETSRFLVESFETLAQAQNQAGIEALLHAIAYGNPKNRYALAGLLIRTTE
ncbi:MAG: HEAT repeat domain-containing protein [Chlamydiales bacterium]|nr:HEAT repeat domain-containing protein [Chlamydiales bacterium]